LTNNLFFVKKPAASIFILGGKKMLECETVKKGMACPFMTSKGCNFNGGACHPIVEQCQGCAHILETGEGKYCRICPDPAVKWRLGKCNFATHMKKNGNGKGHKRLNPLKASKRKTKGL